MSIEIANIKKSFGRTQVLNDISLDIPSGQMVALLGPSGSGKTTLLRIIAGLEHQTSGHIRFHGTDVSRLHARDRKVGFVFQHYALFRHMTVFDNIAFGLTVLPRRERPNAAAIKAKVTKLLEMVQLAHLADRYPAQLSGGQKQRVALARILALEPQAILLDEPFSAQVFKTLADPFVGKISLIKVISGVLTPNTQFSNANCEKLAKAGSVSIMCGKKLTPTFKLIAGDIGVLTKLVDTKTGDTLCDPVHPIVFPWVTYPEPCYSMAIQAKKKGEEDKIMQGLQRLAEEDPSFRIEKPVETSETILSGQGEMQLDVTVKKLASKFGVESVLVDPKIPYRETIRKSIDAEGRHKKQTGGHGQFGHCKILFEPIYDSDTDFEFVDNVVGGVVPRAFIPAVEKGLRENIVKGVIAGYPLVHIRATLHDGSYHPVDSSEMAFKTAARLALKKCVDADPVLLEPIYSLDITVPDEYMGDIIGDMNRRRGRILGMNPVEDGQEVVVEVPLSEIFKYATDLRAMTQGRGSFKKTFVRYEEVPANVAQKIIAAANLPDDDE